MVLSVALVVSQPGATVFAADASGTTASMADILQNQCPDGRWKKATYTEIRRLANEFKKTNDPRFSTAAIKGINFLLSVQYSNGGWPQVC
jgi:PelA/Pel-15E family pectate lyase